MSDRIDQFADGLGQRLATITSMIDAAKLGLKEAKGMTTDEFDFTSYPVRRKFEEAKYVAKAAEVTVAKWVKTKEASDASVIQRTKDECESRQLERQAASAEDDAEAGISLAEAAIVNAVNATYLAIDARRAAEQQKAV